MVSVRHLEHDGIVPVMPVEHIDWEAIRKSLEYRLRSRGVSDDESEELADDAIVAAYQRNTGMTSQRRCAADARSCLATIRMESFQDFVPALSDELAETIVGDRRKSLLSLDRPESAMVRDEIKNLRETRRLFTWFRVRYFEPDWYV